MSASVDFGFDWADPRTWLRSGMNVGKKAIGTGTPAEQIVSNLLIIVAAALSSAVTWGAGLLIVLLALPFLGFGFLRLVPGVNGRWPL